ncbi:MAG: phosphatidylglycerol lysyltransferase domain-containing protein [Eubacteriales bacterium]
MKIQPISLSHREQVESLRAKYHHSSASHSFTTLYINRLDLGCNLYFGEDFFTVQSEWDGENSWFFPCGNRDNALPFVTQVLEKGGRLLYMTQEDTDYLTQKLGTHFCATPSQGDSEYLYDRNEQECLAGHKFMRIRNDISRGKKEGSFTATPLTLDNLHLARTIHDGWLEDREEGYLFPNAGHELLDHFEELDLIGMLGYLNDIPSMVVVGYPLSDTVFDLSMSNQSVRISGISPWTRQQFISSLPKNYTMLNAEEDLDIPGLRLMKQNMRPIDLLQMYIGTGETP